MRHASQELGGLGYYRPGPSEVGANARDSLQANLAKIMTEKLGTVGPGTYFDNAEATLKKLGLDAVYIQNADWPLVVRCIRQCVVIAQVRWRSGGNHGVLLERFTWKTATTTRLGKRRTIKVPATFCVCDPGGGVRSRRGSSSRPRVGRRHCRAPRRLIATPLCVW